MSQQDQSLNSPLWKFNHSLLKLSYFSSFIGKNDLNFIDFLEDVSSPASCLWLWFVPSEISWILVTSSLLKDEAVTVKWTSPENVSLGVLALSLICLIMVWVGKRCPHHCLQMVGEMVLWSYELECYPWSSPASCSIRGSGPCTLPGHHNRAGRDDPGVGELTLGPWKQNWPQHCSLMWRGEGNAVELMMAGESWCADQPCNYTAQKQGYGLTHLNMYPIYDLWELMKGLVM